MADMEVSEFDMADADILGVSPPAVKKRMVILKDFVGNLENWFPGRTKI